MERWNQHMHPQQCTWTWTWTDADMDGHTWTWAWTWMDTPLEASRCTESERMFSSLSDQTRQTVQKPLTSWTVVEDRRRRDVRASRLEPSVILSHVSPYSRSPFRSSTSPYSKRPHRPGRNGNHRPRGPLAVQRAAASGHSWATGRL